MLILVLMLALGALFAPIAGLGIVAVMYRPLLLASALL